MKRLIVFLFSFSAFTGFACSLFTPVRPTEPIPSEASQEVTVSQPTDIPLPTETPVPVPSFNPTTYRNESTGFEFDYPAEWSFDPGEQQSRGGYVQFYSWDWNPGDPIEPLPEGGTVLTVTVLNWDPKHDLEAFIAQRKLAWDASGISVLSEERISLEGDHPAVQYTVQGSDGAQAYFLFTAVGERYLIFSGNGDLGLLADISHTLRFTQ